MSPAAAVFIVCAGLGGLWGLALARRSAHRRRIYREAIGLSLEQVCTLLPPDLRDRRFTRMEIGAIDDLEIEVALILEADRPYRGSPPNIGVVFDRRNGRMVRVLERGIGLGIE